MSKRSRTHSPVPDCITDILRSDSETEEPISEPAPVAVRPQNHRVGVAVNTRVQPKRPRVPNMSQAPVEPSAAMPISNPDSPVGHPLFGPVTRNCPGHYITHRRYIDDDFLQRDPLARGQREPREAQAAQAEVLTPTYSIYSPARITVRPDKCVIEELNELPVFLTGNPILAPAEHSPTEAVECQ